MNYSIVDLKLQKVPRPEGTFYEALGEPNNNRKIE